MPNFPIRDRNSIDDSVMHQQNHTTLDGRTLLCDQIVQTRYRSQSGKIPLGVKPARLKLDSSSLTDPKNVLPSSL